MLSLETTTQRWWALTDRLPPFRQAGNVWQGSGRPTLGRALKPALLSTPATESLCVLLLAPLKWTGRPEWPPREPKPNSSLSILNRASALPFHARPSSSEVQAGKEGNFKLKIWFKVTYSLFYLLKRHTLCFSTSVAERRFPLHRPVRALICS